MFKFPKCAFIGGAVDAAFCMVLDPQGSQTPGGFAASASRENKANPHAKQAL
jgi:hypothetical protein